MTSGAKVLRLPAISPAGHSLDARCFGSLRFLDLPDLTIPVAAALLYTFFALNVQPALAHDPYGSWKVPNNPAVSCCNGQSAERPEGDCRPTRAYMHDDGLWRAWNGHKWLPVPWERVLPTDYAGDGRSHICEKGEWIYCFSPTGPRT